MSERTELARFSRGLRSLIDRTGVTEKELAERGGLGYNTLTRMVRGYSYPTLWSLMRLRDALGCTWEELMSGSDTCRVRMTHPDMGGFHEYVCGTKGTRFRLRGGMNFCPVCGRRVDPDDR